MTDGQICFLHEYCTDCPLRRKCPRRPLFYSEQEDANWKKHTLDSTKRMALLLGFPSSTIEPGASLGVNMMDKRRSRELELHPTFSPD